MMLDSQERQVRALESDAERTYRRVQRWAARMKGQSAANQNLGNHNIRRRACNGENSLSCKPRWKYPKCRSMRPKQPVTSVVNVDKHRLHGVTPSNQDKQNVTDEKALA